MSSFFLYWKPCRGVLFHVLDSFSNCLEQSWSNFQLRSLGHSSTWFQARWAHGSRTCGTPRERLEFDIFWWYTMVQASLIHEVDHISWCEQESETKVYRHIENDLKQNTEIDDCEFVCTAILRPFRQLWTPGQSQGRPEHRGTSEWWQRQRQHRPFPSDRPSPGAGRCRATDGNGHGLRAIATVIQIQGIMQSDSVRDQTWSNYSNLMTISGTAANQWRHSWIGQRCWYFFLASSFTSAVAVKRSSWRHSQTSARCHLCYTLANIWEFVMIVITDSHPVDGSKVAR